MVTLQDPWEDSALEDVRRAATELAIMEIVNPPPPDLLVIRYHPGDTKDVQALVAGMEPWRYHLVKTEEISKGDPEIFGIYRRKL